VEGLSAALPVAGHTGTAGRLALSAVVLTDVAGLERRRRGNRGREEGTEGGRREGGGNRGREEGT